MATSRPFLTHWIVFLGLKFCSALYSPLVLSMYSVLASPESLGGAPHLGVGQGHHSLLAARRESNKGGNTATYT